MKTNEYFMTIYWKLKNLQSEVEKLYMKKKRLEILMDMLYDRSLGNPWSICNKEFNETCEKILEKLSRWSNLSIEIQKTKMYKTFCKTYIS
jgi:recombinational DNA repair protein RecT